MISLIYFLLVFPIVFFFFIVISRYNKKINDTLILLLLGVLLFIVRFLLIFFAPSIGIIPYLKPDLLFYILLMIFGVIVTIIYVKRVEKTRFKELGWEVKKVQKSVLIGFLSFIPLICIIPLILLLADIQLSLDITFEKIILGITFGIVLGGFYEETMFRGVIQNHLMMLTNNSAKKSIILTAIIFTSTHIFYLPFIGFGIFYIFLFVMAVILSILRYMYNQLSCFILHGGIVFILIVFV